MFRLRDRRGADIALGMTHEEIFTDLAQELRSYRELPQIWYQFQTKFRDEPRPKSGLMRVREFTMKDAYSFDLDADGLEPVLPAPARRLPPHLRAARHPGHRGRGLQRHHGRLATRWSSCARPTPARTSSCTATAGTRPTWRRRPRGWTPVEDGDGRAGRAFDTPDARTIEDLTRLHGKPAERQIKTLVYVVDDQLTLVLHARRPRAGRAEAHRHPRRGRPAPGASPTRSVRRSARRREALAPWASRSLPVIADEALRGRTDMATGANRDGVHLQRRRRRPRHPRRTVGRPARGRSPASPAPVAGSRCDVAATVEIGHIFKLGNKYTEALGVTVLGAGRRAGQAHHGLLRHRRGARAGRDRRDATTTTRASCGRWRSRPSQVAIAQLGDAAGGRRGGGVALPGAARATHRRASSTTAPSAPA